MQNLHRGDVVEDEESNTFAVNFTWDPPPFKYRDVLYYKLSYEFSGFTRNQFPCPSSMENSRCTISELVSIKVPLLLLLLIIVHHYTVYTSIYSKEVRDLQFFFTLNMT